MRRAFLLAALFTLTGCASTLPSFMNQPREYESFGSIVERVSGHHLVELEYRDARALRQQAEHRAAQRRTTYKPPRLQTGGMLSLTYYTSTVGSANPQYWEIIVEDLEGNEITRTRGRPGVPNYTVVHGATFWYDVLAVPIHEQPNGPFHVFVYDDISGYSSQFRITPPQK